MENQQKKKSVIFCHITKAFTNIIHQIKLPNWNIIEQKYANLLTGRPRKTEERRGIGIANTELSSHSGSHREPPRYKTDGWGNNISVVPAQ